jgi:hypothetical protein
LGLTGDIVELMESLGNRGIYKKLGRQFEEGDIAGYFVKDTVAKGNWSLRRAGCCRH